MLKCEFHMSFTPASPNPGRVPSYCLHTDPAKGCSRGQHSSQHNPPLHKSQHHLSCTKDRKLLPARGTPWEVCRDNILPGASPQLLKMVPDLLLNPLPYPCSSLCLPEKSPPNSAPSCSQHSPSSRNCCSSCHLGFIKILELDKQIFVGFFFPGFGFFCL